MKDDYEELLRKYRREPDPNVKEAVMSRFAEESENKRRVPINLAFWKRPVPLYVAVVLFVFAGGLAFLAGRTVSSKSQEIKYRDEQRSTSNNVNELLWKELTWESAPADML